MSEIPMEVYFNSGEDEFDYLDMLQGSKSIEGASEVSILTSSAILERKVPKKTNKVKDIRAKFRASFEGSFKQPFDLVISGDEKVREFQRLSERGFYEIFKSILSKPLGINYETTNVKAIRWLQENREDVLDLADRLREPLIRMHKPVENQGYIVAFKRRGKNIFTLNSRTLEYIKTEVKELESKVIEVSVSRFNSRTGTGRCISDMDADSISFSPASAWQHFPVRQKKKMSENLNTLTAGNFQLIRMEVRRVLDVRQRVKHYRVVRVIVDD